MALHIRRGWGVGKRFNLISSVKHMDYAYDSVVLPTGELQGSVPKSQVSGLMLLSVKVEMPTLF